MTRFFIIFLLFLSFPYTTKAQTPNEIRAYNNYISFVNESIHGLLIAHRLFENYNQTVNKYVDLPDYLLNDYSNADLPGNIFIDSEHYFYDRSPYEWHEIALKESKFIGTSGSKLTDIIGQMKSLLDVINVKRITIAQVLENKDLTQIENLHLIYKELESVVVLYDEYFVLYRAFDTVINTVAPNSKNDDFGQSFVKLYDLARQEIYLVRKEEEIQPTSLEIMRVDLQNLERFSSNNVPQKRMFTNLSRLIHSLRELTTKPEIPKEYALYGRHYYYYNIDLLNKTNRYGNGFVAEYNLWIKQNPGGRQALELPQRYKVIYPEKLPKESLKSLSNIQLKTLLSKELPKKVKSPEEVEDRSITVHEERIVIDTSAFDLELYDHLIKDGDRVSINVNGVWLFKDISLEKEPQTITIHIIPGQKNYLLVRADNTGYRPPNTVALAYKNNGVRHEITLVSDMSSSQMVEINYGTN